MVGHDAFTTTKKCQDFTRTKTQMIPEIRYPSRVTKSNNKLTENTKRYPPAYDVLRQHVSTERVWIPCPKSARYLIPVKSKNAKITTNVIYSRCESFQ